MTDQVKIALDALSDQIDKYAELLVKKGAFRGSQPMMAPSIESPILPIEFSAANHVAQISYLGDQRVLRII